MLDHEPEHKSNIWININDILIPTTVNESFQVAWSLFGLNENLHFEFLDN